MATQSSIKLPGPKVQERYGICGRTLNRWKHDPEMGFPEPLTVNNRDYYALDDLETWERQRAAASRKTSKRSAARETSDQRPTAA